MPRKRKNAPPPWWVEPLKEWVREIHLAMISNGHCADAEAFRLLIRNRKEDVAKLMRGFLRQDAPVVQPIADDWRAPPKLPPPDMPLDCAVALLPVLQVELKRRAILNDLPENRRRQICAAAGVIWVAFYAHRQPTRLERGAPRAFDHFGDAVGIARVLPRAESEASALAIAGKVLGAMEAFYGKPRFVLTGSVVRFFTGETVSVDKQRELWDRRNRR